MAVLAAFSAGFTSRFRVELVGVTAGMGRFAALRGDLPLLVLIHARETSRA